jgi:hypothetical protein
MSTNSILYKGTTWCARDHYLINNTLISHNMGEKPKKVTIIGDFVYMEFKNDKTYSTII